MHKMHKKYGFEDSETMKNLQTEDKKIKKIAKFACPPKPGPRPVNFKSPPDTRTKTPVSIISKTNAKPVGIVRCNPLTAKILNQDAKMADKPKATNFTKSVNRKADTT